MGYGLSYTRFARVRLTVEDRQDGLRVAATLSNTGQRLGRVLMQIYVAPPRQPARLAGWVAAELASGQARVVTASALAALDVLQDRWNLAAGRYEVLRVGCSSADSLLVRTVMLRARRLPP